MKKLKMILMIVLSMVVVTGCGSKSPTEVVDYYFSEIKKGENSDITKYLLESTDSESEKTEGEEANELDPKMEEAMNIYLSKLNAKVLSEKIDGDKATVEVEVTGLSFTDIMLEVLQESLANAFSGTEMTDEQMSNSVLEKVKSGKEETRTGNITLSKVDKEWKIDTEDESFIGLMLGKVKDMNNKSM